MQTLQLSISSLFVLYLWLTGAHLIKVIYYTTLCKHLSIPALGVLQLYTNSGLLLVYYIIILIITIGGNVDHNAPINVTPPPLYGDRWGIGGDLTQRMCQIPHPSITIQCQIPTLYIHTRICAGTRANACAGQKPHPWGVISWRIPYQAPPLSPTGGVGRNIDRRIKE